MIKKLKEKKGFTLVELIVVLVILAILAALLIPALTGYIDKAKKKDVIAETRQTVMAAQTVVDEAYAKKDVGTKLILGTDFTKAEVADLAEVPEANITNITLTDDNEIATVVYTNKGKTCTYYKEVPADTTTSDGNYDVK